VRLQIFQEVSSVVPASNLSSSGVTTNKRAVESTVLVNDGQIVVIGGLIQDEVTDNLAKVPVLGDLPLIGGLFKYTTRERKKTNLMVFLRPTLLRSAEHADTITNDRYDYIMGEQLKGKPATDMLPDFGSLTLPPRQSAPPGATEPPAIAAPK
jgi:general secretion pathway protein D